MTTTAPHSRCEVCGAPHVPGIQFRLPFELGRQRASSRRINERPSRNSPRLKELVREMHFKWLDALDILSSFRHFSPHRGDVCQGNHTGTHVANLTHAVDFDLRVGTRVVAAHEGIVADVATHFRAGGDSEDLRWKANFVALRHVRSTSSRDAPLCYSRYYHLARVVVKRGDCVRAGQLLGYSGNTGFTTGPHLHFDVVDTLPCDMVRIRVMMRGEGGGRETGTTTSMVETVACVPFSFSRFPFPSSAIVFDRVFAIQDLFDPALDREDGHHPLRSFLSSSGRNARDTSGSEVPDSSFAVVTRRGGDTNFSQKAVRARALGARLLVVVDNDESMGGALPLLVGDNLGPHDAARPSATGEMWSVFVPFASHLLERAARARSFSLELCAGPLVVAEYCKPMSLPFELVRG